VLAMRMLREDGRGNFSYGDSNKYPRPIHSPEQISLLGS
jgi:hypothetical protein